MGKIKAVEGGKQNQQFGPKIVQFGQSKIVTLMAQPVGMSDGSQGVQYSSVPDNKLLFTIQTKEAPAPVETGDGQAKP